MQLGTVSSKKMTWEKPKWLNVEQRIETEIYGKNNNYKMNYVVYVRYVAFFLE